MDTAGSLSVQGLKASNSSITLWGGVNEDNSFGTHGFMQLVEALGAESFFVGNVGSGTVEEIVDWWEYMNLPGKSPMDVSEAIRHRAACRKRGEGATANARGLAFVIVRSE
jgi:hypothetical protein